MSRRDNILRAIDWWTVGMYLALVLFGWLNIYGASYSFDQTSLFDLGNRAGKQFLWIGISLVVGCAIMLIDAKTYEWLAYLIYGVWIGVLLLTPLLAKDVKGSMSWIQFGGFSLQPAEFAKCFTALALAKYMSRYDYNMRSFKDLLITAMFVLTPMLIIMFPQKETGSALIFAAFLLMFYREGMSGYILLVAAAAVYFFVVTIRFGVVNVPWGLGTWGLFISAISILLIESYFLFFKQHLKKLTGFLWAGAVVLYAIPVVINLWIPVNFNWVALAVVVSSILYLGVLSLHYRRKALLFLLLFAVGAILFCYSCEFAFNHILQPHQQIRIEVLLGLKDDPSGAGYNVNQSQIAIGSGRLLGKGYLQGTQTKLNFVPEQTTDFIFCTIGEEWGFLGSAGVLILYLIFILRMIYLAERQKDKFSRVYAYCVVSIFIAHLAINVGMVLGLMPVIGIPLPFFSYGGSSLLGFSVLLFILLRLDAARVNKVR